MADKINPLAKIFPDGMDETFLRHYSILTDNVNALAGHRGSIPLANHINMNGNRLTAVGEPVAATDAIASGIAEQKYSAGSLVKALESNGDNPLKSVRRLNDKNQRESSSSFLNDLMSSVPSANGIFPLVTNVLGGVQVIIPSSLFTFADRSTVLLVSRTDLLSLPTSYAISTISATGTTVTAVLATPPAIAAGQAVTIDGVTPASFNGTWQLTSVSGSTITYQASLGTVTGSGGTVYVNGIYYYGVSKRSTTVLLFGPYPSDSAANRLQSNFDGVQIVAVVVITASGGQVASSGGGGSAITGAPTSGAFF